MTLTQELPESTRSTSNGPRVAIVGSGVIGLHCALEVVRAGGKPDIFETGRELKPPFSWVRPTLDKVESRADVNALRIKALGGTTLHWGGTIPRLEWSQHKDWLNTEFYDIAERYLGVFYHKPSWFEKHYLLPGVQRLGWKASAWANTADPDRCAAFATCSPHCPIGARYSPMKTVSTLRAYGVEIATGVHVTKLDDLMMKYDLVIVAAGTIENTRFALTHGIPVKQASAHGAVMTSCEAPVKTGAFRIGYPAMKILRKNWDIFVNPLAGYTAPEWLARGWNPEMWGYEFVLASHTAWKKHNIRVSLAGEVDHFGVRIPRIDMSDVAPYIHECRQEHIELASAMGGVATDKWLHGISWDHLSGTLRDSWDNGELLFLGNSSLPTIGKANPTLTALAFAIQELRKRL